ncbi:hypothetical protein DPMN_137748 [Dreissena polymorpha]|uniref:C2H2-type domain-containing protein n=1 Tax=Dreissena polymorpha TaxID=45954 RepID=A0A9D4G6C3_DREPO|nr:hypothetical protein DPMN_137748 [Dreissena polymorpha]
MTSTQKSFLQMASKNYKRRKLGTECNDVDSGTDSKTPIIEDIDSTMQPDVNFSSVIQETLSSGRTPDDLNSVCVKIETDESYNTCKANGFFSAFVQVKQEEIYQDHKQDVFNFSYEESEVKGCVAKDPDLTKQDGFNLAGVKLEQTECEVMQDDSRQAGFNSVCANRNQIADSNARTESDGLITVCGKTKQSTGEKLYKCELCVFASNRISSLKVHMRRHTGEKRFKCEVCDYKCSQSSNLKTHKRIHTGEKQFKCEVCGCDFNKSSHLKVHLRIHTGEKLFKCELCDYKCSQSSHLKRHIRKHTGEKPYKCELCGYECIESSNLKTHMRIHTGEKPFKCEVCGNDFNTSDKLKVHMRIHTGEKPYKCEVCGYVFNQRSALKVHIRIHTGEKPYKCWVCDYVFIQSGTLKVHMRIHTGERLYKCEVCDYKYNQSFSLKRHIKIHKGERLNVLGMWFCKKLDWLN